MATELEVQFNPAPAYLFDYLTADIQTSECIFDLIDNSIDAARSIMSARSNDGNASFPDDYSGFRIDITLSSEKVVIHDNCSGISETVFANLAFRAGEKSQHPFGIGHFGVGLKRAILKIGNRCTVETDDGKANLTLAFTRADLDQSADLKLPASKLPSHGSRYTTISVDDIKPDTKREIASLRWNTTTIDNIGRRYGLFIRKGLVIAVNEDEVKAFAPQPAETQYIELQSFSDEIHGVHVDIVAGVHEQYRFGKNAKGEIGADPDNLATHKLIANEYGWYVVCNDRVILLHDTSYKTGWTTNWHPEYSGFVGWVTFRSKDPSLLPWTTKKSDILENSEVYEEIVPILQKMAAQYRHTTPLAKGRRKGGAALATTGSGKQAQTVTAKSV